ncbi:MAG: DHH family phosphoesterase [Anaerolineales bacterium]
MNDLQIKIKEQIQSAQRILITSHIRPDGDAIGSSLALGLALLDAGKQVQVVLSDGVPASFKHLPGSEIITTWAKGEFNLIICVDCSDLKRVGQALDGYHSPDIVIDHHSTTKAFGTLNLVDSQAAATASVLTRFMPAWGLTITAPIAANLLTGIVTDTLGFRTSNTTPAILRQAADLIELGADMGTLYFRSLISRTFPSAKYWGAGLSNLESAGGIVWTALTLADRKISGYTGNDDADLISYLSSIEEADVAIIFVEQDKMNTKVSWRALKPDLDVAQIASRFGGGGHKAAAGADMSGSLDEVRDRVLETTRKALQLPI